MATGYYPANVVYYHDGVVIPTLPPKDPNSDEWFGFDYSLLDGEYILHSSWLINDTLVEPGDTVDGMTFEDSIMASNKTRVRLSGSTKGVVYEITNRYGTNVQPSLDRSFYLNIQDL